MLKFILFLLFVYIAYKIFRFFLYSSSPRNAAPKSGDTHIRYAPPPKKTKYGDLGEYVDYEDLKHK